MTAPYALDPADPTSDLKRDRAIQRSLLAWYQTHSRSLPWRDSSNPYSVWISEVMLQQTQVATVIPYFQRWIARFPNVEALARSAERDVLESWQGLGYYSRARNLRRAAQFIVEQLEGRFPASPEALVALPGVGPYTAGAVSSIAFGLDAPIVDGNVVRVLTRLFALPGDPARNPLKATLWELAERLIPTGEAAQFNQSMMELGALCCTPKTPSCGTCPVAKHCLANRQGDATGFPHTKRRPETTHVYQVALVLRRPAEASTEVLLRQRSSDASRWASMWEFPTLEYSSEESPQQALERLRKELSRDGALNPRYRPGSALQKLETRHSVTRYRIHLSAFAPAPTNRHLTVRSPYRWVDTRNLARLPLPAGPRRIADWLQRGQADLPKLRSSGTGQ